MNTTLNVVVTVGSFGLVVLMAWSLWSLLAAPLHEIQRMWWVLGILIVPGLGSLVWWWWIKYYYPRRKAEDPDWDPSRRKSTRTYTGRPRPSRRRHEQPLD